MLKQKKAKQQRAVFVGEAGDSACGYYRCCIPAFGLQAHGWRTAVSSLMLIDEQEGFITGWNGNEPLKPYPDVVIMRRLNEPDEMGQATATFKSMLSTIRKARKNGQRVYVDLDDDPWNLPEWNPAYGNMKQYDVDLWAEDMAACDGVICSTEALAESVRKNTGATAFVCRNGIEPVHYQRKSLEHAPFRLGWAGTTDYRGRDLETIVPMLTEGLQDRLGAVEFWHLGSRIDRESVRSILGPKFPVQIVERPWVPITQWHHSLCEVDALLIPMEDIPFNHSRSNVMGLAACAAGIPFAAPFWHEEYNLLWRMGAGYPLPDSTNADFLSVLTQPEYLAARADMSQGGRTVANNHTPDITAKQYLEVFNASQ